MAEFIDDGSLYEEAKSLYKKIYYKIQDHPPFKEDVENALRDMYWQGYNDAKADMEYEYSNDVEIKTQAGKDMFKYFNDNYGSSIWGPILKGILAIEKELR